MNIKIKKLSRDEKSAMIRRLLRVLIPLLVIMLVVLLQTKFMLIQ
jgi:hypothetical protein